MTIHLPRERALGDLLQSERELRLTSEEAVRNLHQLLVNAASRLDGARIEALQREDPSIPSRWGVQEWRSFFEGIALPNRAWNADRDPRANQAQKKFLERISELQDALARAEAELRERREAEKTAVPAEMKETIEKDLLPIAKLPEQATPALPIVIADLKLVARKIPSVIPRVLTNALSGGGRGGGDKARAYGRYWLVLRMIGRWKMCAAVEIEEALANVVGVSSGSGSLRRILLDMEEAKLLVSAVLESGSPRTALKVLRLTVEGQSLYQSLFRDRAREDDWSRMIRLHEGQVQTAHTLAVLAFSIHARKRGWATIVLPDVPHSKARPDVMVLRGEKKYFVEVELSRKEDSSKWALNAELNGGTVVLCAANLKSRGILKDFCQSSRLPGIAADLESLIRGPFRNIHASLPLWLEEWQ